MVTARQQSGKPELRRPRCVASGFLNEKDFAEQVAPQRSARLFITVRVPFSSPMRVLTVLAQWCP
ncbi:hypothetical protein GN244_ATG13394 [Phytophthora infestans]|uniref:Uncharacterized protein n=1 Tax=Phytophthora infestans TaxID=4787 RepID=A0A833S6P8_PHYIN|nr:hypothetical protein GN244_ATG18325 [Phytophthora infestans]KAF4034651.1 hypothetical protein GN244_ATG13394 [Phytophthora infestans]